MAKIELGILGPFHGKVGNVIGYERNGVFCVRSMPTHYRDRRSAAQLKNRNRFAMVMKVMGEVKCATKLGFNRFASGMTEMNVATRVNYYSLVREGASGLVYSYDGLVLSRGRVEKVGGVTMGVAGRNVSLWWDANGLDAMGGGDDEVTVVLMNGKRIEMKMWRGAARRSDGRVNVAMPSGWEGEDVYCYVMAERDGEWSESVYVGAVNGNGLSTVGSRGDDGTDFVLSRDDGALGEDSDQSAIKVLSDSGLSRDEKGAEMPPGGDEKRKGS